MLFTRRMAREAATPLAARIVAARPAARSIAFVARPAAAVIARRVGVLAVAGTAASVTSGGAVLAESKGWPGIEELQNDPAGVLQELAQEAGPVVSVGMVSGFASGFALKKAGKVAAVVLGGVFMGLQGLASQGIITINWGRTTEIFGQYADVNGDGKVDKGDAEAAIKELQARLTKDMGPAAGGFGTGFLLGLRYG